MFKEFHVSPTTMETGDYLNGAMCWLRTNAGSVWREMMTGTGFIDTEGKGLISAYLRG